MLFLCAFIVEFDESNGVFEFLSLFCFLKHLSIVWFDESLILFFLKYLKFQKKQISLSYEKHQEKLVKDFIDQINEFNDILKYESKLEKKISQLRILMV